MSYVAAGFAIVGCLSFGLSMMGLGAAFVATGLTLVSKIFNDPDSDYFVACRAWVFSLLFGFFASLSIGISFILQHFFAGKSLFL